MVKYLEKILTTKKNKAKTTYAPIYQNEGPVNSNNLNISSSSNEYDAKLRRYEALLAKKRGAWFVWRWDTDQPELEALEKWLREHASQ